MRIYICTPINARQEPTMSGKLLAARHRIAIVLEGLQGLPCGIDQRWINEFKKVVGGNVHERPEIFNF
jgi:hypothetical protein